MRIKRLFYVTVRWVSLKANRLKIYYWADAQCYALRTVAIMPMIYYRFLFRICMWLASYDRWGRVANRGIHTIPYHIRFNVA
jgi:hypothetical protein